LRIQLPGDLPDLTFHRLALLCLLFFWFQNRSTWERARPIALFGWFIFWAITHFLATIFTEISFAASLKRFLDFVLEVSLFYVVVATTIREPDQALRVLRAVWVGLLVVAVLAFIEKYTRFNPVDAFVPDYTRRDTAGSDINSTYPHRILLGTAMAMAWPLAFAMMFIGPARARVSPTALWISVILFLSACYFAMSRGPWLATIMAGAVLVVLGSRQIRRKLLLVGALAGLMLIIRPGVWDSISSLAMSTTDDNSVKASSYKYRLELWKIAWAKVTESPLRLLVGCGPGVGEQQELDWEVSWRGTERQIESWDNHYAYDLYQAGLPGLLATFGLYAAAFLMVFRARAGTDENGRTIAACFLASVLVLIFMMSNVLIFAKQLNFLFWFLIPAGTVLTRATESDTPAADEFELSGADADASEPAKASVNS
jgi:O-antigen ligase